MSKKKLAAIITACTVIVIVVIVLIISHPWGPPITPVMYSLSVDVNPPQAGSVSPAGGEYESGVQVILTASPATGYTFDHWSGSSSGTTSTITIAMDSDKSVIAHFVEKFTLSVIISPSGAGSVSPPGGQYETGEQVSLTASPSSGYTFDHWSGSTSDTSPTITITMNRDYSITANFEAASSTRYNLTISSTSGGSVATPGEGIFTYDEGTVVDLVAEADEGYSFANWSGDASTIADAEDASTTITMNDNYSITANFEEGDVTPDFTLPTMTGAGITLSELIGTPVVLYFWTILCPPCTEKLPYVDNVAQQSGGEIEVIAVNMADSAATVQSFFGDYEPTMIVALDENGEVFADYCQKYDNSSGGTPFTLFVDGEGIVKYVRIGAFGSEAQLWDALESVLGFE